MTTNDDPQPASVDTLLGMYAQLGIPHFQRGLLWKSDSVALLLESLYHGTPCGTILLWKPLKPEHHGIPLQGTAPDLMIVDGQQRLRSLHRVVFGSDKAERWCLNLARVPEVAAAASLKANDLDLFHRVEGKGATSAVPSGHINLAAVWGSRWEEVRASLPRPELFVVLEQASVLERVAKMRTRSLFWRATIAETPASNNLAAVVRIYNRINSAGVQVEPEERAYAALVAAHPDFANWIRSLFEEIHGAHAVGTDRLSDRDEALRRDQERRFGFKLFVRVFVQFWAYHCRDTKGENSLSFDLLTNPRVMAQLTDPTNLAHVEYMLERSREAIRFVHTMLSRDLYCDSYAFLPETRALIPVFQLLVRFPELMADPSARVELQWLVLRMLLASRMSQRDVVLMVRTVNTAPLASEAIAGLRARAGDTRTAIRQLPMALAQGRSITDRYLLLLYWLTRRAGARDFSYKNLSEKDEAAIRVKYRTEVEIAADVTPEKQHILPFAGLRDVFDISGRGRPAAHEVNNLANMTYISRALNDFDGGLGSRCMDVTLEGDNLQAHFLAESWRIVDQLKNKTEWSQKDRPQVRKFMDARRRTIAAGFASWLEHLDKGGLEARIKADRRRIAPDVEDMIREMGYPDPLEDALLACLIAYRCGKPHRTNDLVTFRLRTKGTGVTLRVRFSPTAIEVKGLREGMLTERFGAAAGRPTEEGKQSVIFRYALPDQAVAAGDAFVAFASPASVGAVG